MKNIAIILSVACFCFGFTFLEKSKSFRPPGTVEIVDGFFFDDIERTNLDWREYLSWIEKKGDGKDSKAYRNALPDSTIWMDEVEYGEPLRTNYLTHRAFDNYPVVGISYEQAVAYCEWRTDRVKDMCKANGIDCPNFKYRLPTNLEWELIATTGNNSHEKKVKKVVKKLNQEQVLYNMIYSKNLKEMTTILPKGEAQSGKYDAYTLTSDKDIFEVRNLAPSRSYLPNSYDIYNLIGNVSEMVAEKGIAKGGSFVDPYEEGIVSKKYSYDTPQKWLGFRCVAEILE